MIHLTLLVRQLACAVATGLVDHCGRHNLLVTSGSCLIEEEVDERTLQPCTHAAIYRETSASNLHTQVKVNQVVLLGQFPVRQTCALNHGIGIPVAHGILSLYALLERALHHPVVFSAASFGHNLVRDIGYCTKESHQLGLCLRLCLFQFAVGLLQLGHFGLHLFSLLLLALLHQTANLSSHLLGFRQISVQFGLCLTTGLIHIENLLNSLGGIGEMLLLQTTHHAVFLFSNEF